jgi:hypothetical protein
MIHSTKIGDCQVEGCGSKNTNCIKVGKVLYCIKCRTDLKKKEHSEKEIKRSTQRVYRVNKFKSVDNDLSFYINELDSLISKYIRMSYADSDGMVDCFTCSWRGSWKESDCGHFISRKIYGLRWDRRNLKVQCKNCNINLSGNLEAYKNNLEKMLPGITSELKDISRSVIKIDRQELKELIIDYRYKNELIKNKFNT